MSLFDAIEAHDLDRLAALLRAGADPDAIQPDDPRWRPLHAAIDALEDGGPVEAVVLLLRHGATVDAWDGNADATPLLMAVFRGAAEAVRLLLAAGADPNVSGGEGDTPLRWCVEQRDLTCVATLLRCGAAATIDTFGGPTGMSALGRAVANLDTPMVHLLVQAGADPGALDADRRTPAERLPSPPRDPAAATLIRALLADAARRRAP